jgi:hypothetical protein
MPKEAKETDNRRHRLLGLFASVPWVSALRFLTYIDTRTRRDGWDIQVRFLALEHRHEGLT